MMMLGFSAGLIAKNIVISGGGLWIEPLILYVLCIADPGSRKTAIFSLWNDAMGKVSKEFAVLDEKEKSIPFQVGAITEESLKYTVANSAHVVASADEFMTIWGAVLKRNDCGSFRALFLELWNGCGIRSSTKTAGQTECVDSHFGVVAFGQWDMLLKYCIQNDYSDGLFDRFLISCIRPVNVSVRDQTDLPENIPGTHSILRAVFLLIQTRKAEERFILTLSPDAQEEILNIVDDSRKRVTIESDAGRKHILSKAAGNCPDFAYLIPLLFFCFFLD